MQNFFEIFQNIFKKKSSRHKIHVNWAQRSDSKMMKLFYKADFEGSLIRPRLQICFGRYEKCSLFPLETFQRSPHLNTHKSYFKPTSPKRSILAAKFALIKNLQFRKLSPNYQILDPFGIFIEIIEITYKASSIRLRNTCPSLWLT